MDTESPGMMPWAIRPLAMAMTLSRNSVALNDAHSPCSFLYSTKESFGVRFTRSSSTEKIFLSVSICCSKGRVYSLYMAFLPCVIVVHAAS